MKKLLYTAFINCSLLTGCASHLGEQFTKLEKPKKDEAIVYFYRPSSFVGAAVSYDIKEGDNLITEMYNGGYNYYTTNPGDKTYWAETEAKDDVSLNLEKGRIYFIKAGLSMGVFIGHPNLSLVPTETALSEIKECKKVLSDKE